MNRRLSILLLLLPVIALGLIFWTPSGSRRIVLPGGATLELREVTYGTTHVYTRGGPRNRLLTLFPKRFRQRFGVKGPTMMVGSTNLALWLERDGAGEVAFLICDDTGAGLVPEISARMSSGSGSEFIEAWSFSTFPRRAKEFTVRVHGATSGTEAGPYLGEWKIQNPVVQPYPVWTPEPLPITRTAGDLGVTLHELKTGVSWPGAPDSQYTVQHRDRAVRAVLSLTQGDKPAEDWAPVSIETSDATGNRRANTAWSFQSLNGQHTIHYQWGLWPGESAWKLKVELAQRANFPPEQLWTVRGLVLSETNLSAFPAARTEMQGATVQLQRLVPSPISEGMRTLFLTVLPHREDLRFTVVGASDDLGRNVPVRGQGWSGASRTFDFKPAPDAKSLNFNFALHPTRLVEFAVKPELSRETNASPEFPPPSGSATITQ